MNVSGRTCKWLSAALVAVLGSASMASAHECFNASRSDRANAVIAQHSHGWFDIHTSQVIAILVLSCAQQPSGDCPPPPPLSADDLAALHNGPFDVLVGQILGFIPASPPVADLLAFLTENGCLRADQFGGPVHRVEPGFDDFP